MQEHQYNHLIFSKALTKALSYLLQKSTTFVALKFGPTYDVTDQLIDYAREAERVFWREIEKYETE